MQCVKDTKVTLVSYRKDQVELAIRKAEDSTTADRLHEMRVSLVDANNSRHNYIFMSSPQRTVVKIHGVVKTYDLPLARETTESGQCKDIWWLLEQPEQMSILLRYSLRHMLHLRCVQFVH